MYSSKKSPLAEGLFCAIILAMYEVRVEADFAAAHFLKDYHGKCENLHGHNYKVYVHVRGEVLDNGGMLMDFSILKKNLREICNTMDHTNLNELKDSQGTLIFDNNPSAERIATYIYNKLRDALEPYLSPTQTASISNGASTPKTIPYIYAVDVFETETSRARYIPT